MGSNTPQLSLTLLKHMKKQLVILSDLWGRERSEWVNHYIRPLQEKFEVRYYDCCELGGVDTSDYKQEVLHWQFVDGGVDRAVEQLLVLEQSNVTVLAFSVGGTIAWKFALEGGQVESLYCISSTRLRYETMRPESEIVLCFGEDDPFIPSKEWFDKMNVTSDILPDKGHELYMEAEFAEQLSRRILNESSY
ncbi:alpha/beta hydrolase [Fulvivirga kasyanovii]